MATPRIARDVRNEKDLTIQQLSNLTGINTSYISEIERAERDPSIIQADVICKVLSSPELGVVYKPKDLFPDVAQKAQEVAQRWNA